MKQFLLYNFASADILAFSVIEFVDKSVMTRFLDMIFLQNKIHFMNRIRTRLVRCLITYWIGF